MLRRYQLQHSTPVGFPQLVASYDAPPSSGEDGEEAASEGASLSILGEIFSKMILVPSIDELGLGVEGEGGLAQAREDLLAQKAAAAAAAGRQTSEAEVTSGEEGKEDDADLQATELGMDIDG